MEDWIQKITTVWDVQEGKLLVKEINTIANLLLSVKGNLEKETGATVGDRR